MNQPIPTAAAPRRAARALGATLFSLTLIAAAGPTLARPDSGREKARRERVNVEKPATKPAARPDKRPNVTAIPAPRTPRAPSPPRVVDRPSVVRPTPPPAGDRRDGDGRGGDSRSGDSRSGDSRGGEHWNGDRDRGDWGRGNRGDWGRGDHGGDRERWRSDDSHTHRGYRGHGRYDRDDRWSHGDRRWHRPAYRYYRQRYYDPYHSFSSRFYRDAWGFDHDPFGCSHQHHVGFDLFRQFRVPELILRSSAYLYQPYFYARIWSSEHDHFHLVYRFPTWDDDEWFYRPYAYCDGHLYGRGWFGDDGPEWDVDVDLSLHFDF